MRLLRWLYEKRHHQTAPYYYNYNLMTVLSKPIRKLFTNVIAPYCPFACIRIFIYRMCGFKIGKHCFIGMRCYLDDTCYNLLTIGNNCTISYGVFFACHGYNQPHLPITVQDEVYIGMRASIISKSPSGRGIVIGTRAVIGACALVNRDVPAGATIVGVPCRIIETSGETANE